MHRPNSGEADKERTCRIPVFQKIGMLRPRLLLYVRGKRCIVSNLQGWSRREKKRIGRDVNTTLYAAAEMSSTRACPENPLKICLSWRICGIRTPSVYQEEMCESYRELVGENLSSYTLPSATYSKQPNRRLHYHDDR